MLDEEPMAAGADRPDGEGEANAGAPAQPTPTDRTEPAATELTAALLREPEVGEEHAETTPVEPTEPTEPTERPERTEAPEGEAGQPMEPPAVVSVARFRRSRVAAVVVGLVGIAALVTAGAFVAMPHATPAPSSTAAPVAVRTATAAPTAAPATPKPSAWVPDVTPTPEPTEIVLSPDAGTIAFSDDFTGKNAGWPTASTGLTTLSMGAGVYVVGGKTASTDHLVEAPYEPRLPQIAVTATATQSSGKGTTGFGVTCGSVTTPGTEPSLPAEASAPASPPPTREILFEFVVLSNGGWLIARRDGPPDRSVQPVVLMHGTTASVPGARPLTVSGICASAPGGSRTRLIFSINGLKVMDFSDVSATVTEGWRGGLVVSTVNAKTSVAFRHVEIRDLAAQ